MTPLFGRPGHWKLLPQLDPRGLGVLASGHTLALPCPACVAAAEAAEARAAAAPPPHALPARRTGVKRRALALVPPLAPAAIGDAPAPLPEAPAPALTLPATPPAHLTLRQRLLFALATFGDDAVRLPTLAVRAWELFPASFGLKGYVDTHPSSAAVYAKLSGADGVCGLGWAERGLNTVTITERGRAALRALCRRGAP